MSAVQEHDNQTYTKEHDEIEQYLLRIIHRFFTTENNNNKESIEAIIVESITRLKQDLLNEGYEFIFSLNDKTGNINLTIHDFGGESSFGKNTAFNKDFGNKKDTICMGNDPRLYDERTPLPHIHTIDNIKGLQEELEKIILPPASNTHIHSNSTTLDLLVYMGTKVNIDLILLEQLEKAIEEHTKNFLYYQKEIKDRNDLEINKEEDILKSIQQSLLNAKEIVKTVYSWIDIAKEYTDNRLNQLIIEANSIFRTYLTKTKLEQLVNHIKKSYYYVEDGEISIPDGTFQFTPIEEEYYLSAGSGSGDSLRKIYDSGLRIGVDDWAWDNTVGSFSFQSNTDWAMFASLQRFDCYTHRVTLKSQHFDDDVISVVIAYDPDTNKYLAVHTSCGGVFSNAYSVARVNQGTGTINPDSGSCNIVASKNIGPHNANNAWSDTPNAGWRGLPNGITVLVKRDYNRIRIWIKFNAPHSWFETTENEVPDIYPTENPTFDFDLRNYSFLSDFVDKKCCYGYGCYSQTYSIYEDVYFKGIIEIDESYGHTNINSVTKIEQTLPSELMAKVLKGKVRMFFRCDAYDIEGEKITYDYPLPYEFIDVNDHKVFIQCGIEEDTGKWHIEVNLMQNFPFYFTNANFYQPDHIIVAVCIDPDNYSNVHALLEEKGFELALIDSEEKNNFVKGLLGNGKEYFIQGKIEPNKDDVLHPNKPCNMEGDLLSFHDFRDGEPEEVTETHYIKYDITKKWKATLPNYCCGYITEGYIGSKLSDYFVNPRIYYQIYETKET